MKIEISEATRKWLTLAEVPAAKDIISEYKHYSNEAIHSDIKSATRIASQDNGDYEILKFKTEIAGNGRIWNYYGENSGKLDIWVNAYVLDIYNAFYSIGFYLSDIWSLDGENAEQIRENMYVEEYKLKNKKGVTL